MYIVTNIETNVQTNVSQVTVGELGGIPRAVIGQRVLLVKTSNPSETDAQHLTSLAESFNWRGTEEGSLYFVNLRGNLAQLPAKTDKVSVWDWETCTWVDPRTAEQRYEQAAEDVRTKRNKLLQVSDWTQGRDISTAVSAIWAPYRAQLRDISAQPGFPFNVVWPDIPTVLPAGLSRLDVQISNNRL